MMIDIRLRGLIILSCLYYCTSENITQLDKQVINYTDSKSESKQYLLFNESSSGHMTKIYDSSTNQIKFIIPINSSTIKIIPK